MRISIIIPVLNEERHGMLRGIFESIKNQEGDSELIIVDGGSDDKTSQFSQKFGRVIAAPSTNRAERMNIGAKESSGEILLFHHPRTVLPPSALKPIVNSLKDEKIVGGGFTHSFDTQSALLRLTSWYSNHMRFNRGIIYLDHMIFIRRSVYDDIGGFKNVPIFEDTLFPIEMKKRGRLIRLNEKVRTSAKRFQAGGLMKHGLKNQLLKLGFELGVSPKKLNQFYEGRNPFNVKPSL